MPNDKLIDEIIDAIDRGEDISVALDKLTDPVEKTRVKALLSVQRISKQIRNKQTTATEHQFAAGDRWLHLVIQEKIGAGGFGQVFRAHDSVLQTDVAVKFLSRDVSGMDETDFLHEARLMATVRNPHVLAIHGAAQDQGVSGYWSDYLNGQILFEFLQEKVLTDNEKIEIIEDLSVAVTAAHKNGVVHGDIKSLNVMLQPNRGAILLDFGSGRTNIASANDDLLQASPIAMAPEQFDGQGNSMAADVFSLGLLMVEVLTGKHPFLNLSLEQIKASAGGLSTRLRGSQIPKNWQGLLAEMLSKDPEQRPNIETVANKIAAIEEKPLKTAKRMALGAVVALLLAVTGSSLYGYFSIKQANQQTEAINKILYDNFLTISPHKQGNSVKLVEVMDQVGDKVFADTELSKQNQEKLLVRMVGTYLTLSDLEHVLDLGNKVLVMPDLQTLNKMKVMRYVGLAHSHQREFTQAETFFKDILELQANTVQEFDAQLKAINPLMFGYLESEEFNKIPALLTTMDKLAPGGSNRPIMLGAMEHTKALYFTDTNQKLKAREAYTKAAGFYAQHFHPEHYSVLESYAMAATQYAHFEDASLRQEGIDELLKLIPQMKSVMGADHNLYLIAEINLAEGYALNGQAENALEIMLKMQATVYEKLGRTNKLSLLLFDVVLANSYAADGQFLKAEETYQSIISNLKKDHQEDNQAILRAAMHLINHYLKTKNFEKADAMIVLYLPLAQQEFGENHRLALEIQALDAKIQFGDPGKEDAGQLELVFDKHIKYLGIEDHQTLALKKSIETLTNDNTN